MVKRAKRVTLTFEKPFTLKGISRQFAPGQYEVVPDDELTGELTFLPIYRCVSTLIFLPLDGPSSVELRHVNATDLAVAHERDRFNR